jgi:hypothetical protein
MARRAALSALAAFCLLALGGCGGSTARLAGKVLLQGQPVPNAEIELAPVDDATKNYRGISLADGTYQLDYGQDAGLPLGKYRATVTVYLTEDGQPLPEGEAGQGLKSSGKAVVQKYVLELTVDQSSANLNLDLDQATPETASPQ